MPEHAMFTKELKRLEPSGRTVHVAVVGLPLGEHFPTGSTDIEKSYTRFTEGLTDRPRKLVIDHLNRFAKTLEARKIRLVVHDVGECVPIAEQVGYSPKEYNTMLHRVGKKLADGLKGYDQVIVIGPEDTPRHDLAFLAYHFPGRVVHIDAHADMGDRVTPALVHGGNYVRHAIEQGVKRHDQIMHWGLHPKEQRGKNIVESEHGAMAEIYDLDTDALKTPDEKARISHMTEADWPGRLTVSQVGQAILRARPKVLVFGEVWMDSESAKQLIRGFSRLAALGAVRKKVKLM